MNKTRKKVLIALALMVPILFIYSVMDVVAQPVEKFESPSRTFPLAINELGPGRLESVEPTGWFKVPIGGTIPPYTVWSYGPYYPIAIYVCIDSESPNIGLSVTIYVGGSPAWMGVLYAGQCSPTVTADGRETYVTVGNAFGVSITFAGRIMLYSP